MTRDADYVYALIHVLAGFGVGVGCMALLAALDPTHITPRAGTPPLVSGVVYTVLIMGCLGMAAWITHYHTHHEYDDGEVVG